MIKLLIILYFVAGLYFVYVSTTALGDSLKGKDADLFFKVLLFILLCWPVCFLLGLKDSDDDEEDN